MRENSIRGKKHLLRGGLFERLAREASDYDGPGVYHDELDSLLSSIKTNLNKILNTRSGNAQSSTELGVGDFNDAQSSALNMSKTVCADIKRSIEDFEPRIKHVIVTQIIDQGAPLRLHFVISGDVVFRDKARTIEFNLLLDKGRSCRVI